MQNVSGGTDGSNSNEDRFIPGMPNPYNTPEKKKAYQDYKNGIISQSELNEILNG